MVAEGLRVARRCGARAVAALWAPGAAHLQPPLAGAAGARARRRGNKMILFGSFGSLSLGRSVLEASFL